MSTYRPKPATAAWIARERKRLGLSVEQLRDRMRAYGVDVGRQTIQVWESYADRKPSAQNLDALERIFESAAPEKPNASPDVDLAAAIRELTDELRAMRQERESGEVRLRALEAEVRSLRAQRAAEESPERSAPGVTTG